MKHTAVSTVTAMPVVYQQSGSGGIVEHAGFLPDGTCVAGGVAFDPPNFLGVTERVAFDPQNFVGVTEGIVSAMACWGPGI